MSDLQKRKQWIITGVFGAIALGSLYGISQMLRVEHTQLSDRGETALTRTMIAEKTNGASPEMSWVTNGRERVERLETVASEFAAQLAKIENDAEAKLAEVTNSYDDQIVQQQAEIEALKTALAQTGNGYRIPSGTGGANEFLKTSAAAPTSLRDGKPLFAGGAPLGAGQSTGGTGPQSTGNAAGLDRFQSPFDRTFTLASVDTGEDATEEDETVLLENYLPAGSYAPATVLSGVDASTGVVSQSEPIPVIFRITGAAITAGTRSTSGHKVNLTGCTVTGSARGDLSSERVYVRLLKMSCIKDGREVFETDVAGYMSGAGKTGSRGLVTSREGKLVQSAAIAGALGGLAGGLQNIGQTASGAEQASFDQVLNSAAASSASGAVSSAADRLSEYYINRAEQYQPVVSLYGGTEVELVFLEGIKLD